MIITGSQATLNLIKLPRYEYRLGLLKSGAPTEGLLEYEYKPLKNLRGSDGKLKDFRSTLLNFDLNHPVTLQTQESYDGTVNLILTDDKNPIRLVNSRFTPKEDNRYEILDRQGNNDTNIYDESTLEREINLFKTINQIVQLDFNGLGDGNLPVGSYSFYFKLEDADGNRTDIVSESGIVHVPINSGTTTYGGLLNENSYKSVKFVLNNIDSSYDYVRVYYSVNQSDGSTSIPNKSFKLINEKFRITNIQTNLIITGYETTTDVSFLEVFSTNSTVSTSKSITQCKNRLFLANVTKETPNYLELRELSARIYPRTRLNSIGSDYGDAYNQYYNVGYWPKEIYKFGIVYILSDNTTTPVFPIRGVNELKDHAYTKTTFKTDDNINTISNDNGYLGSKLENVNGVSRLLPDDYNPKTQVLSVEMVIPSDTIHYLKSMTKGFYFVRQKRIPTILFQACTIGITEGSWLPAIPISNDTADIDSIISDNVTIERSGKIFQFIRNVANQYNYILGRRTISIKNGNTPRFKLKGLISPDVALNQSMYSDILTGNEYVLTPSYIQTNTSYVKTDRLYRKPIISRFRNNSLISSRLVYVPYGTELKAIDKDNKFSSLAGNAGNPGKFKYASMFKNNQGLYVTDDDDDRCIVRGEFLPYIGSSQELMEGHYDVHIPNYNTNESTIKEYFDIRRDDNTAFYPISDRYEWSRLIEQKGSRNISGNLTSIAKDDLSKSININCFRGDCFISTVTHKIHHNFVDPSTPFVSKIVDPLTFGNWYTKNIGNLLLPGKEKEETFNKTPKDIFTVADAGDANITSSNYIKAAETSGDLKINRVDMNSLDIGNWVEFTVMSNHNLTLRSIDPTNVKEIERNGGIPRGFYPKYPLSNEGGYGIRESLVFNSSYSVALNESSKFLVPDVPIINTLYDGRIMFSNKHITEGFRNNYRVFPELNSRDYTRNYGGIVKVLDYFGNLLVIFEHAIGLIPVDERAALSTNTAEIYIGTPNVIADSIQIINDNVGSTWPDSIIKTSDYVYGVDSNFKCIWRINQGKFEDISELNLDTFLNKYLKMNIFDNKAEIGKRNIISGFDYYRGEVYFTFIYEDREFNEGVPVVRKQDGSYNSYAKECCGTGYANLTSKQFWKKCCDEHQQYCKWNLVYSEKNQKFITRTSFIPAFTQSINDQFLSIDHERIKDMKNTFEANQPYPSYADLEGCFKCYKNNVLLPNCNTNYDKKVVDPSCKDCVEYYDANGDPSDSSNYVYATLKDNCTSSIQNNSVGIWKEVRHGTSFKCNFYGKQHPFSFEFVVADQPMIHKVFNNLIILSNRAKPDFIEFEVDGSAYDLYDDLIGSAIEYRDGRHFFQSTGTEVSIIDPENVLFLKQQVKDITKVGRLQGNVQYKNNQWFLQISPVTLPLNKGPKQTRVRDNSIKIKIIYDNKDSLDKKAVTRELINVYNIITEYNPVY